MLHRLCVVARPSCRPLAPLDRVPGPPCSACSALRRPRIKVATSGPVVMVNSYLYECFEQASVRVVARFRRKRAFVPPLGPAKGGQVMFRSDTGTGPLFERLDGRIGASEIPD